MVIDAHTMQSLGKISRHVGFKQWNPAASRTWKSGKSCATTGHCYARSSSPFFSSLFMYIVRDNATDWILHGNKSILRRLNKSNAIISNFLSHFHHYFALLVSRINRKNTRSAYNMYAFSAKVITFTFYIRTPAIRRSIRSFEVEIFFFIFPVMRVRFFWLRSILSIGFLVGGGKSEKLVLFDDSGRR